MAKSKYSKKAQKVISAKMSKMKDEKMPRDQKIAISISEAASKNLKVPAKKKKKAKK